MAERMDFRHGRRIETVFRERTEEALKEALKKYMGDFPVEGYATKVTQIPTYFEAVWGVRFVPHWEAKVTRNDSCD